MFKRFCILVVGLLIPVVLSSCARHPQKPPVEDTIVYRADESETLSQRFAPVFIVEEADKDFNRIGRVEASDTDEDGVRVNPDIPVVYASMQQFSTDRASYTNLLYRIHFSKVPFGIIPFYLGYGENVGLIVVATLDADNSPLLYTIVHTCGCYLAFIPTSNLSEELWPEGWQNGRQNIYGENLPAFLDLENSDDNMLALQLRPATHRVKDVFLVSPDTLAKYRVLKTTFLPFLSLEYLDMPDGSTTSFYEEVGPRKGYVKGSQKIWERLLISWWAFDWRVGEDKKLGLDTSDGIVFYTSLKPWARQESDMRDFQRFLAYWGWKF